MLRGFFIHTNLVYQIERLHWQRGKSPRALNVLSVLTLGAVLALVTVHGNTPRDGQIVLLAMIAIHTHHFVTSFLAVSFAYESIYREQRNHAWDLLRITPLTRTALFVGKLRAVWAWVAPLYFRLIGVKLIFLFWQLTQIHSKAHIAMRQPFFTSRFQDNQFLVISAAAVLFVVVYLLVDLLFTTTLGMSTALAIPPHGRRLGLAAGLLLRWHLSVLTLISLLVWQFKGIDPLPTQWNTHLSMAARYTEGYGFGYVGGYGAVVDVFPSLTVTIPDGPLLVFMHTTASAHVSTTGIYFSLLLYSLFAYLGLVVGTMVIGWLAVHLRYK